MSGDFTIAWTLTSDGRDLFADRALVSVLSARLTNPSARLRILADADSAAALRQARHRVLEACDELVAVPTPDGSPVFRNRWVKTRAAGLVDGDCILIDCDTVVAGDASAAWPLVDEVGVVANHNAPDLERQVWREDLAFLRRNGWPDDFAWYGNGGVVYFRQTPAVSEFFRRWHLLWRRGVEETGRERDQPALNTALRESGVRVRELPQAFNCQVSTAFSRPEDAPVVWHFYGSRPGIPHGHYADLVSLARRASVESLRGAIRRAIDGNALDPARRERHGARFKPAVEASLEPALGRDVALLLSAEYEGMFRNGGIGTYFREISLLFRERGWFTVLLNLGPRPAEDVPHLPGLDRIFHAEEFGQFMELDEGNGLLLAAAQPCHLDDAGTRSLLFIQAMANTLPGQRIYAEFHEMSGPGYHAAKAAESGWLAPEVVVAVTMHSGTEWIHDANDAMLTPDNGAFLSAAVREEDSFRSADLAMYPSDSLHGIVGSYGWRTGHAVKLPTPIPLPPPQSDRPARPRRTMTILCAGGLANRLSTLAAGYWLARFFRFQPVVWWPRDNQCDCPLERLFRGPGDVPAIDTSPWAPGQRALLGECTIMAHKPIEGFPHTAPRKIADREHLQRVLGDARGPVLYFDNWFPGWLDPAGALRLFERDFALDAEVAREAAAFATAHQVALRAAVHLRLTDFGVGLEHYEPAVREAEARFPGEPVFLCSDNREAEEHYLRSFPRLFVRPKLAFVAKLDSSLPWLDTTRPAGSRERYNVHRGEAAVIEGLRDLCLLATAASVHTLARPDGSVSSFFRFARLWNPGLVRAGSLPARELVPDRALLHELVFRFPKTGEPAKAEP